MELTSTQTGFEFDCQDTLEVMDLYVLFPDDLTNSERNDCADHLGICKSCTMEYLRLGIIDTALRESCDCLKESGVIDELKIIKSEVEISDKEIAEFRFKNMMERALTRRRRREQRQRAAKNKRIAKRISAIAACIIAVFGAYLTVTHLTGSQNTTPKLAANPTETPVKIELLTDSGSKIITAGQPIIASNTLKTLRVNDNRRMIMNAGTELSIIPHNLGCVVKLDKGEIFADVQHDGKPFIVATAHGRAVITGTTFNIKADKNQMELAVAEGTVSFESDKGKVNVTAGHKSLLASNTKPTMPLPCDTTKLIAWTTGDTDQQEIPAVAYQSEPEIDLGPEFGERQIELERINYASWVEQKRDWFKREFPQIFKFKEALAKDGIEADYPELLIKSGDLWRFAFPEETRTQLIPANYESMIKLANAYDKNDNWLSNNLHISQANLTSDNETSDLKALERWAKALKETLDLQSEISTELLTHSLHASVHLSETRTLAWLTINNDQIALNAIEKQKTATLLDQQIAAASNCIMQFKQQFVRSYPSSTCDEDKQQTSLQDIIGNIEQITEIEKKIAEYETFSK